jgi:hypothetical protein
MLEAKAKDMAVMALRRALRRYAPDVASVFGWGKKGIRGVGSKE